MPTTTTRPATTALPDAPVRPSTVIHHGITLTDNYAWLRADNWQDVMRDPAVLAADIRAYLEAENAHTEAAMADVSGLRDALFAEMKGRLKPDDSMVPGPDGPYEYYARYEIGGQYAVLCRKPRDGGAGATETVLLNGNLEAKGKAYWQLGATARSPDHGLLAYAGEIAARTEQFWCPVKHARRAVAAHARYRDFAEYGDAEAYQAGVDALRLKMRAKPPTA